jgi:endonuclease III related protein
VNQSPDIISLYDSLSSFYGPSGWWPGETPFEIIVGAVLTQNTAWTNVERAISNLKSAGMLDFDALYLAEDEDLANLIRPAGYFNIKTKRLRNLLEKIAGAGGMDAFINLKTARLRDMLLTVNGIGPETADSICCYAAGRPVFVVDAYTKRMLSRHGFAGERSSYQEVQNIFMNALKPDLRLFKDLHAYIVFVGKDFCRKRNPGCEGCPVSSLWGNPPCSIFHSR